MRQVAILSDGFALFLIPRLNFCSVGNLTSSGPAKFLQRKWHPPLRSEKRGNKLI